MNWSFKKIGLILLVLCMATGLAADSAVFIGDGDVGSVKLYDRTGRPLDATVEDVGDIGEGWIVSTPESDLLIVTPVGTVNLYQGSIAITAALSSRDIEIALIRGKATFKATDLLGGSLTVSTPASRYTLREAGEVYVVTSDNEESVTVFSGRVNSYNLITKRSATILPFEKLYMQDMSRTSEPIQSGYYYTYATFPEVSVARLSSEERVATTLPVPATPAFKGVTISKVALLPVAAVEPIGVHVSVEEQVRVPETVSSIDVTAAAEEVAVMTITPIAVPQPPQVSTPAIEREAEEEEEEVAMLPPMPTFIGVQRSPIIEEGAPAEERPVAIPGPPSFSTVHSSAVEPTPVSIPPIPTVPTLGAPSVEAEPAAPAAETVATVSAPRPALVSSAAQEKQGSSIGIELGYEFLLDGTDANTMVHRLYAKPYFSKGPFAIRLNGSVQTSDFTDITNSIIPIPTGILNRINYIFGYIDHLRIGYETSPFYLVADHSRSLRSELSTFFAPPFGEDNRLVIQNKITIGAFSLFSSLDDLRVDNLRGGNNQYASMLLQFTAPKGYPLTVALGALADLETYPHSVDLYPVLSFKLPIINSRTTHFSALIQAQGYLPAYPTIDFSQFVDTTLPSFFPNYLLGAGFSLTKGAFSARVLASLNEGHNHNFLVNDFTYSNIDTAYDSAFDVLAELGWKSDHVKANVAMNLPLTSSFSFATLTSGGHGADFSQLSLALIIKDVTVGLGVQQLGIITTIKDLAHGSGSLLDLLSGPYAASYLSASYTWAPFTLTAKATYPANSTSFTVPIVSVTAKVDLNKRF